MQRLLLRRRRGRLASRRDPPLPVPRRQMLLPSVTPQSIAVDRAFSAKQRVANRVQTGRSSSTTLVRLKHWSCPRPTGSMLRPCTPRTEERALFISAKQLAIDAGKMSLALEPTGSLKRQTEALKKTLSSSWSTYTSLVPAAKAALPKQGHEVACEAPQSHKVILGSRYSRELL
jgi:hypothetical protein